MYSMRVANHFARAGSSRRMWLTPSTPKLLIALALFVMFGASPAEAQLLPGVDFDFSVNFELDPERDVPGNFAALFLSSPVINGLNAALLAVALLMYLYFLVSVKTRRLAPPEFVDEVTKLAVRGKHEAAADLCRAHRRVFIARIVQRCMDNAGKRHSVLMDMLEAEGRRRAEVVWNRLSYLSDIGTVAPVLGLLGTVMGMMEVFFGLAREADGAAIVSRGLAEALATTMFGLMVAAQARDRRLATQFRRERRGTHRPAREISEPSGQRIDGHSCGYGVLDAAAQSGGGVRRDHGRH